MTTPAIAFPPLALALGGLEPAQVLAPPIPTGGDLIRACIDFASRHRFAGVQLDITRPGIRPRELDRSARRDLAAVLRRNQLVCSGLDAFLPPAHFIDAANVDRAVTGVLQAIDLAADLSALAASGPAPSVSLNLPEKLPPDVLTTLTFRAESRGVRLADHAWPVSSREAPMLGVGLDPAVLLTAVADPAATASHLGSTLVLARLTDCSRSLPGVRVAPGGERGKLDLLAYAIALITGGYAGHAVLDLRGLPQQAQAIAQSLSAWRSAM